MPLHREARPALKHSAAVATQQATSSKGAARRAFALNAPFPPLTHRLSDIEQMTSPHRIIAPRGVFTPEREYRAAVEKIRTDEGWTDHIWSFHWQLYMIATFSEPVSQDYARRSGVEFIESIPDAFGLVAWGPGSTGGRAHVHLLLGRIWTGHARRTGLNQVALNAKRIARKWQHGHVPKSVPFDPGRRSTYLVDHHEVELVGHLKKHRARRKK